MSAKDYSIGVSALTGTIYITKTSKTNSEVMTDDRAEVPKSKFIGAIPEWTLSQIKETDDTLYITTASGTVAEIKLYREKLLPSSRKKK